MEYLLGFGAEEILQQPVEVLMPDRYRQSHREKLAEYFSNPQSRLLRDREFVARRSDGTEVPVEISLGPVVAEEGVLIVAVIRDLTARKRTEITLRRNEQTQATLIALLELSLEPIGLEEQLGRALDVLFEVSWVRLESKGAIFLTERTPPRLVMKAQRGLAEELISECRTAPFGRCLCGQAAATGQVIFASGIDERHEIRLSNMQPHGHYCVPIQSDGHVLGVINLYLARAHEQSIEDDLAADRNTPRFVEALDAGSPVSRTRCDPLLAGGAEPDDGAVQSRLANNRSHRDPFDGDARRAGEQVPGIYRLPIRSRKQPLRRGHGGLGTMGPAPR